MTRLRRPVSILAYEVERLQFAEALQELLNLFFVKMRRQSAHENFIRGVRYIGRHDAW